MNPKYLLSYLYSAFVFTQIYAQAPAKPHAGEIRQMLERLNVLGTVLYVAAHPDDENTRLITYFANEEHLRTAYLSATRGDGGQNLIGPEIREELGVIRTQELLAARRVDGGRQFFSRANDFGYSKHPDETFNIWNKEEVLSDFVWIFRKFRPDVIITRFTTIPGVTHGHHTASALLAREAFELSDDPNAFPEQLEYVEPWKPKKIFWNTSWWFYRRSGEKMDTTGMTALNVGKYNPLLGKSYNEIAAESRSMHKSQGFGSSGSRGDEMEYLVQWEGTSTKKIFDDIETSWDRVEGSKEIAFWIQKSIDEYDPSNPSEILPQLMMARKSLMSVEDKFWKKIKLDEIDHLIKAVTGFYVELVADVGSYVPGDSVRIALEAINRSNEALKLERISFDKWPGQTPFGNILAPNKKFTSEMNFKFPEGLDYSDPYWLKSVASLGMYTVHEQLLRGKAENDPELVGTITVSIGEESIPFDIPVVFKRTDPVEGEVYEPIAIGPPVMVNMDNDVLVFADDKAKSIDVRIIAGRKNVRGILALETSEGWSVEPEKQNFRLNQKGEEQIYSFHVIPPKKSCEGMLRAIISMDDGRYDRGFTQIVYDHLPTQSVFPKSEVRTVKLDLKRDGDMIGYIMGAGDAIPENLRQIGYNVDLLEKDQVEVSALAKYDAVILGVRAFNTVDWLVYKNIELFEYVKNGGTLLIQYNTSHRLVTKDIAPYELKLSRDRVTVEEAPIRILAKDHQVLHKPNKISQDDFDGWVQERGLYFPNEWSDDFVPILSSNDPEESPKDGGLLIAEYGEGHYIYSGYSWFRELPAGIPGAYRLFVNLISLGND